MQSGCNILASGATLSCHSRLACGFDLSPGGHLGNQVG
jgi:hypothetical protein